MSEAMVSAIENRCPLCRPDLFDRADVTLALADSMTLDRLQDVLRSSVDGACELLLIAAGFEAPVARVAELRDLRALDIESRTCPPSLHDSRTPMHKRWRWHWRPRARQLETGIAR